MPTIMTHTAVPISLWIALGKKTIPLKLLTAGMIFSVLPDADVIAFKLGIPYEADLGHRGLSHSIGFAFSLSIFACVLVRRFQVKARILIPFLFLSILSHGLLDAMTSGGLGVGFLVPYSSERFFFDYRPIRVSPIGVKNFLTARGMTVLRSEFLFVWIPFLSISVLVFLLRTLTRRIRVPIHKNKADN
ncbi:metal-dependent hydrolase [Leptospira sp. 201903071]|uniref:metal-dependent hydrolase n=1 Tax=Leptospira ainazelensis TaxID=2810034 RepID=UPI0019663230|nr:metal-dependent hydrolase [Leptospira ainazelensis]MBM9501336.1 metal-dependent hydrolase [Leptospira ainazelensis]